MSDKPMSREQSEIRKSILRMCLASKEGHIASSFSIIEILLAIYTYHVEKGEGCHFLERTILSKGHAAFGLYGLMNLYNLLSDSEIERVCSVGSYLIGHVPVKPEKGFFCGTGSLGQGFPLALGKAFGSVVRGVNSSTFVILGDGELNEGSCWETLLLMKKFPKVHLRVLIDNNSSSTRAIPMGEVFEFLGKCWKTQFVDGHNIQSITEALVANDDAENLVLVCNTFKGYPIKEMINNPAWHHRTPSDKEVSEFYRELDEFFSRVP